MSKLRLNRKGVEMTMQTLVVIILLLVVLAVLIFIFTQQTGKGSESFTKIREQLDQGAKKVIENITNIGNTAPDSESGNYAIAENMAYGESAY